MNIVTYAAQNMKPFQDQAFHSVDSLILSCVVYMHFPRANPALCDWDGVPLPALFHAEDFDTIFEHVYDAPASKELLTALVASPRFREIRVKGYVQQSDRSTEKQFAAMTLICRTARHISRSAERMPRSSVGRKILIWRSSIRSRRRRKPRTI